MTRFDLTDSEWAMIAPLLEIKLRAVQRVDDRQVLNGIFWRLRTGADWEDIPPRYGPPVVCQNRFERWRRAGYWDRVMAAIASANEDHLERAETPAVRLYQQGAIAMRRANAPLRGALAREPENDDSCPCRCLWHAHDHRIDQGSTA